MEFAIDKEESLYSINLLKNVYNITEAPTLVINNNKYEGLMDSKSIEDLLVL